MTPIDTAAGIGELASWAGLGLGIPLLLLGWWMRAHDGAWAPVRIVVAEGPRGAVARWYAGGDFHQRRLSHGERAHVTAGERSAHVSERRPARMRLQVPALPRILLVVGAVLTAVGALGFVLSLLPLLG